MSFFGQGNNQQGTGFGGFGSNNNSGTGFGQSSNTNTGFGATSGATGGGLFGTSNNNTTNTGFGGFGATGSTASPFGGGNTSGFGANTSSGGGMFGSNTATAGTSTGFGGFGSNNANTGGGLFGGSGVSKPAFGSSQPATGTSLFGGGGGTGGFGSSNNQTTTAFGGAPLSSALASNNAECQGTGSTPFQTTSEKEGTGNLTNHYQSITFMQPYKNFSFEELRLADYNQGRRFGNASGQAGAFGTSTGFGGFGGQTTGGGFGSNSQGTGLFGAQTTTSAPFGGSQTATSGFGSTSTGGGAFGSATSKPGGLFGSTPAQPAAGGLFGSSNQSGGFGAQNNTAGTGFGNNQGGGGLFGTNNNQQKPGFSFGQSSNTTSGFGASGNAGFGATGNTNTGGGLFGSNPSSTPFGGGQQQQSTNPFGGGFGNNQQNQNQAQANTGSGFGGFGNTDQQKPGGLFGNNTTTGSTGTGLFGAANQNNQQSSTTGGGLFGNANNQAGGSSLFGAKPATTGTGLFGTNNTANTGNTGGGLFGNNQGQNQQNQSGGLFGTANNQQQQKPGGLFGNSTGGGLFGSNNNNNQQQGSSSIFGGGLGSNNQQQQPGGFFGASNNNTSSLFGNSQQQQQPQQANNALQAPQAYTASIFDPNPYGSRSIFDGLPPPPQQYTGPIATPIGQKNKSQKGAVLPQYRINPHVASRFVTPQKRQGYGFTYSTYGTPSSASSNMSTPGGMSSSLLAGSISRGLGKSLSTSNLRRSFDPDQESLLSPGAFSAGSSRYAGTGSLKKLTIDRSLRTDLFQSPPALPSSDRNDQSRQPGILKKKVSFDASTIGGNGEGLNGAQANGVNGTAENSREGGKPYSPEQAQSTSSQPNGQTGSQPDSGPAQAEMEQVRGNELAIINEDGNQDVQSTENTRKAPQIPAHDPPPGNYYMKPSHEEIARMSTEEKKRVSNFQIGRENCGYVVFDQPVDLTSVPLDRIFGEIAQIELRSVTVYPDAKHKPARGKGLNVPSTIYLANSWPRNRFEKSGPRFQKHVQRLERVQGTEFVRYEKDTGTWVFKVKHFSTYALDYEDDEGDTFQSSTLSAPPESPTPQSRLPRAGSTPMPLGSLQDSSILSSDLSVSSSGPDDTFEFRRKKLLPGAFDEAAISDEETGATAEMAQANGSNPSFLDQRLAATASDDGGLSDSSNMEYQDGSQDLVVREQQLDMAGSFPQVDGGHEQANLMDQSLLGSIQVPNGLGTPGRLVDFNDEGDWAEELRRTISPRKQDRHALRESQARVMQRKADDNDKTPKASVRHGTARPTFANTMDLMNSLYPEEQVRRKKGKAGRAGQGKAFQYPYPKTLTPNGDGKGHLQDHDRQWHDSFKPSWGPETVLLYAIPGDQRPSKRAATKTRNAIENMTTIVSEGRNVRFAKFAETPWLTPDSLSLQKNHTHIVIDQGVPSARPQQVPFRGIVASAKSGAPNEKSTWTLASILFDELEPTAFGNIPADAKATYEYRVRKNLLGGFWASICFGDAQKAVTGAASAEERALHYLSANALVKACEVLVEAKDFRLATLVAQLPADQVMAEDLAGQINEWRKLCVLSEMTEPIRALYEICAGNVGVCEGKKGPIEDQAKTFVISQRFGLDWRRAFGLRLWYATKAEEPAEAAIKLFYHGMRNDEPVRPTPLFIKDGSQPADEESSSYEDVHWGLLKLFAASRSALPSQSLADIVLPHNAVGNPMDFRLSFQLYHALAHLFPAAADQSKADRLSWDFAHQLESRGEWLWSVFILLHLSKPDLRQKALLDLLGRHAGDIPAEETIFPFNSLTRDFKIPAAWIWEAKALHARSALQDHSKEILYLQNAGNWAEAHTTLCQVVGPQCVIEQDFHTLKHLLKGFNAGKHTIEDAWRKGGEIYEGYTALVVQGKHDAETVEKLVHALLELVEERKGSFDFEEGIAVREIAGEVAEVVAKGGYEGELSDRILQLPLADDQHRRHSVEMSLKRFEDVMRGKRNAISH